MKKIFPTTLDFRYAICVSFDDAYSKFFNILLEAIRENTGEVCLDIVVLSDSICEENKKRLKDVIDQSKNLTIRFFEIDSLLEENEIKSFRDVLGDKCLHWPINIFFRMLIPYIFTNYERVLYLDSDTLVRKNYLDLFEVDNENKSIIVVEDLVLTFALPLKNIMCSAQGLKRYFNSGMIMFCKFSPIDRRDGVMQFIKSVSKIVEGREINFPDQDILNVLYENDCHYVGREFNFQTGIFLELNSSDALKFEGELEDAKIIHFTGDKPWCFTLLNESVKKLYWEKVNSAQSDFKLEVSRYYEEDRTLFMKRMRFRKYLVLIKIGIYSLVSLVDKRKIENLRKYLRIYSLIKSQ